MPSRDNSIETIDINESISIDAYEILGDDYLIEMIHDFNEIMDEITSFDRCFIGDDFQEEREDRLLIAEHIAYNASDFSNPDSSALKQATIMFHEFLDKAYNDANDVVLSESICNAAVCYQKVQQALVHSPPMIMRCFLLTMVLFLTYL